MSSETEASTPTPAETPTPREPTLAALASSIASESGQLLHEHIHLFEAELREQLHELKRATEHSAIGVVAITVGVMFILFGFVRVLQDWVKLPEPTAWLITGAISLGIGCVFHFLGRRRLSRMRLLPHRTLRSLIDCWKSLLAKVR